MKPTSVGFERVSEIRIWVSEIGIWVGEIGRRVEEIGIIGVIRDIGLIRTVKVRPTEVDRTFNYIFFSIRKLTIRKLTIGNSLLEKLVIS